MRGSKRGVRQLGALGLVAVALSWSAGGAAQPPQADAAEPASTGASTEGTNAKQAPSKDTTSAVQPSPLNPEANEFPNTAPAAVPAELDRLLADIAALRSRVSALMTSLFRSKLIVNVESSGDEARVVGLVVTLDGGVIYSSNTLVTDEAKKVYEHSVAPGHHVLGIQIERVDATAKQYRTWQESRFSLIVPDKRRVEANFKLEDDSDMGSSFPSSEAGEYSLDVDLFAHVVE
jgi:hypothetical protein